MLIWILQIGEALPIDRGARMLRTSLLADQLALREHKVIWWASTFNHFQKNWYYNKDTELKINDYLTIKALKGVGYSKNVSLSRIIDHRIIARKFRKMAPAMQQPDIIISSMPSYDLAFESVIYAEKRDIPVVVDIRDQWPDIFLDAVPERIKWLARILMASEFSMLKKLLTKADGLISMTSDILDWGLQKASRKKTRRDKVFYLGYKRDILSTLSEDNRIHELIRKMEGKFIVSFIGTFGIYHNPQIMIECAENIKDSEILFVVAGDGELAIHLKSKATHLENVIFPGWLNQAEVTALLRHSHVGVCPTGEHANKGFFPNKAFTYFSEGLPVLTSFKGDLEGFIKEYKIGLHYDDLDGLTAAISQLKSNYELYKSMRRNVFKVFKEKFDAKLIYASYADYIESLAKGHKKKI